VIRTAASKIRQQEGSESPPSFVCAMRARSEWRFEEIDSYQATICFPARLRKIRAARCSTASRLREVHPRAQVCLADTGSVRRGRVSTLPPASVAEIAAEMARKLKLGLETRPAEEQTAAAKAWLAERRALLVLDDIWENDVEALAPGPPVSMLCTSRRHTLPWISPTHSMLHKKQEALCMELGNQPLALKVVC
jgi:hypothetical protein